MTWQTAQPARVNRSLKDSSPVTNGTLSGVRGPPTVSLGMTRGDGVRRAQITDRQINAIAAHTTAGFGDRGSGCNVEGSKA